MPKKATNRTAKLAPNESKNNKGVHSKNRTSWNKNSKNYVKAYRGQGR